MEEKQQKPTFKELLETHGISFANFYLAAQGIPGYEIEALINLNIGVLQAVQDILNKFNELTGEQYTISDIFTRHIYGLLPMPVPEEDLEP